MTNIEAQRRYDAACAEIERACAALWSDDPRDARDLGVDEAKREKRATLNFLEDHGWEVDGCGRVKAIRR